jgi:RHS repeat-associated protein
MGHTYQYLYDPLGRPTRATNPDSTYQTVQYDDAARTATALDENGHRKVYYYDWLGRLVKIAEHNGPSIYYTNYSYDRAGNQLLIQDAKSQSTSFTFNSLNRLVRTDYPDDTYETRSYDNAGTLVTRVDPRGHSITYTYDAINRLVNKNYPNSTSVSYVYDKNGNRISMTDPNFSTYYTYDTRNRLTSETKRMDSVNYTLTFTYDKASNPLSLTYPDGFKLNYTYDDLNRISGMGSYATFTYRLDSALQSISFGNSVLTNYTYDSRDRPTRIKTTRGMDTLLDLNYGYDLVGNILTINSETYSYDELDRLVSSTGPWGNITYTYDSVGNRLTKVEGGNQTTYTYGAYNKLTQAGSTTYSYDNNGNTISKNDGQNTHSYTYDYENRMTKAIKNGQTIGEYFYDGEGVRAKKIESGQTLLYLYQGFDAIYEKTIGSDAVKHLLAGALRIAKFTSTSTLYYHLDHLGSTRLLTDGSGQSLFEKNFKPFGPDYGGYGSEAYKYTGRPQDSPTGLYYLLARYYDSEIGRFTTQDPIMGTEYSPQTLNRYTYVANNPLRSTDPSGEIAQLAAAVLAAACAALFTYAFTRSVNRATAVAVAVGLGVLGLDWFGCLLAEELVYHALNRYNPSGAEPTTTVTVTQTTTVTQTPIATTAPTTGTYEEIYELGPPIGTKRVRQVEHPTIVIPADPLINVSRSASGEITAIFNETCGWFKESGQGGFYHEFSWYDLH